MGDAQSREKHHHKQGYHKKCADKTEFFSDDGEDEIRLRFGQIQELLSRIAQTDTEDASFGKGVKRPDHLVPGTVSPFAVVPGVQPYADTVGAIAGQPDNAHDPDYDNQGNEAFHRKFPKPHRRNNTYEDDGRRAHIGLGLVQKRNRQDDEHHRRNERLLRVREFIAEIVEHLRRSQYDGNLGKLRRLQTEASDKNPSLRAEDFGADEGNG